MAYTPRPLRWAVPFSLILFASCEPSLPPPTDLGVAWELAEHRARTLSGIEYGIELTVPEDAAEPIHGRSSIRLDWHDPDGHGLVLDFMQPQERVSEVRVNDAVVAWEPVNDHVVVPAAALREGANVVELDYVAGDEALNRNDGFLYALFVPDRAHFSLPVFDQPNLKASVRWTLTVPREWEVVANGPLMERREGADGATVEFAASRPLPTYLFAFAAGRFEVDSETVDGRVLRMWHRETDADKVARNRDAIFELHGRALAWLEEYTGIEYPFQSFGIVLVPSFQYGGMEHPGGILYRQAGLMLDESATQQQILGRASVIAHETAHMWFGDLVTMNWFDDVWTKEVFANFMAAKIVHPSFPEVDHDLRFLMAHHPAAYGVDRTPGANAIRQPLDNLREAGSLYGAIIYQKAPIVMKHLEQRVGEETFRQGLREYLSRYSYGNATWPDLIGILDRLSPQDLSAWSRVWVEDSGRPTITVERDGSDVVLLAVDPEGRDRVWPQTLRVRLAYEKGDTLIPVELASQPVRLSGAATRDLRYVLPNGTGVEYGAFVLDEASLAFLVGGVGDLDSALVRGTAWVTLWDQVLEGRLAAEAFLESVLEALPVEEDELNVSRLLAYGASTYWRLLSRERRDAWAPRVEAALWAEVNGARPVTARASFFGAYRDLAQTPAGVERLRRLWAGESEVEGLTFSETDETALATALAVRGVTGWSEILDEQEARITNPDRRARFRFVRPSLDADPAVRRAFFESLSDPVNREQEPWVLAGLSNLNHPLRASSARAFIRTALEMVPEIQRTGDIFFPGRWLDAVLGGHNSPEAADEVSSFLAETPELPPRLRGKVLQSVDMLWRSAGIVHGWRSADIQDGSE